MDPPRIGRFAIVAVAVFAALLLLGDCDCTNCTASVTTAEEAKPNGAHPDSTGRPDSQPVDQPAAVEVAYIYVGNTNTHRFHRQSCHYAGCPNCTAKFASRDEAIAAGFRPGGCCDP